MAYTTQSEEVRRVVEVVWTGTAIPCRVSCGRTLRGALLLAAASTFPLPIAQSSAFTAAGPLPARTELTFQQPDRPVSVHITVTQPLPLKARHAAASAVFFVLHIDNERSSARHSSLVVFS